MKIPCELVQDMIPLYIDDGCSEKSKELLAEHLKECKDCGTMYQNMRGDLPMEQMENQKDNQEYLAEIKPMKKVKKRHIVITAAACVVMILLGIKATTMAVDAGMYPLTVSPTPSPDNPESWDDNRETVYYLGSTVSDFTEEVKMIAEEEFTVRTYYKEKAENYVIPEGVNRIEPIKENQPRIYGTLVETNETSNGSMEEADAPKGEYEEKVHFYIREYVKDNTVEIVVKCFYTVRYYQNNTILLTSVQFELYASEEYSDTKLEMKPIQNNSYQTGYVFADLVILHSDLIKSQEYREPVYFIVTPGTCWFVE